MIRESLGECTNQWFLGHINEYLRPGVTLTCCVDFWSKIIYVDSTTMSFKWEQLFYLLLCHSSMKLTE